MRGITRLTINLFRSPLATQPETILIDEKEKAIKDCVDIDFDYAIIYVCGFRVDKNYVLKDKEICTIRITHGLFFGAGLAIAWAGQTLVSSWIHGRTFTEQALADAQSFVGKIKDFFTPKNDSTSNNPDTTTQSIPQLQGAKNQSGYQKPVPLVLGRTLYTPNYCGNVYRTISGTDGEKQTFHCLYMLGYNDILVEDIKLGLRTLSTNPNNITDGVFTKANGDFDGRWDAEKYHIQMELRQTDVEVGLYPQKVSEEQLNTELTYINSTDRLVLDRFSAKNPMTVEVEFTINGLIGYNDDTGAEENKSVEIELLASFDGGANYVPFGQITGSNSYNSSTGVSTITRKKNKVMRFVATRTLTYAEATNLPDGVLEIRIARHNAKAEGNSVFDTVYLSGIRTWSYDPKLSEQAGELVAQRPLDPVRRSMTARLALQIDADEIEFKGTLDSLNCILTAKGRTYSNGEWSDATSPTQNPASMALLLLQHPSRGKYAYEDSQLDMTAFGQFYEWCEQARSQTDSTPKFKCNGVITNKKKTKDYLDSILDCGRAKFLYNGRKISCWIDKERTIPVMVLNNQNILSVQNSKALDDLPDGFKCKFINEMTWQSDEWEVTINENAPANPSYQSIDLVFQTDAKQIYQNLLFYYAKIKLRPETWNIKVSVDGNLLDFGSLIEIQNETISVGIGDGAEIKEVVVENGYITKIKTDGNMYVDDLTKEYGIKVTCADGVNEPKVMSYKVDIARVGEQSEFVFHTPILNSETYKPNVGDIISFGFLDNETTKALCFGKKDNGDGTFNLVLVPYQEGIYTADSGTIPEFVSNVSNVPQRDSGDYQIDKNAEALASVNQKVYGVESGTADIGNPDTPTGVTAYAREQGIDINWDAISDNGLKNAVKAYIVEISKNSGETWTQYQVYTNHFEYLFDRSEGADEYPEASAFNTWRVRVKVENLYGKSSQYSSPLTTITTTEYGTWIIPEVTLKKSVENRTAVISAVYGTPEKPLYGKVQTLVRIKRLGNTDEEGGRTFNQILDITPDEVFYKPEFEKSVHYDSETTPWTNEELNYKTESTDFYENDSYVIAHELPLMGQTSRIFKSGNILVEKNSQPVFTRNVPESAEVPVNPSEGDVFRYTGNATGTWQTNAYYLYENSEWTQVFAKSMSVPTKYQYEVVLTNESGYRTTAKYIIVEALCTNIADIVHSHEHYKDLYVEKLSAITANIGMISQGGMGEFDPNSGNYWALSDLKPEDVGIAGGIMKGAFRVGGTNEYFRVTPKADPNYPNDPSKRTYTIELKAGNIELTSSVSGDEALNFQNGTYVYTSDKQARLNLTPSGIVVQKWMQVYIEQVPLGTENPEEEGWYEKVNDNYVLSEDTTVNPTKTYYAYVYQWVQQAEVKIDANGNLVISNSKDTPPFGYQVTGSSIYHFDTVAEHDESGSNTQLITCTGSIGNTSDYGSMLNDSPKCFVGKIEKFVTNYVGKIVFFTRASGVQLDRIFNVDGTIVGSAVYNDEMSKTLGQETVGEYLGLTAQQISDGIFEDNEE